MLAPTDLLEVWEAGLGAGDVQRTVLLHAAARPGDDGLLDVPVGERDADLFALRGALFGATMPVRLTCPGCAEELELDFDTRAVVGSRRPAPGPVTVVAGEWSVALRLPTSADVLAAAGAPDAEAAARELLSRCVIEASRAGRPVDAADLPADVRERVGLAAAEADPCADVQLDVRCPECGRSTRAELDIAACLWAELDAWARATLLDVHLLASSYGWSEPAVLALSPVRRRHYLELAGHA